MYDGLNEKELANKAIKWATFVIGEIIEKDYKGASSSTDMVKELIEELRTR